MRYRNVMAISLCMACGVICTSVRQSSAQDADSFGGSSASQQKATQTKVITRRSLSNGDPSVSLPNRLSDKTRQRLQEPITLDYEEVSWSDVERQLEERLGINIILAQSAKDDSLDVDEPMSMQLRDVPGNYALRLLLREKNATYFVQSGVIQIISIDDAETDPKYFVRKVFDVDDLLGAIKRWNDLHREEFEKPKDNPVPASPVPETPNASNSSNNNPRVIIRAAASAGQFGGGGGGRRWKWWWRRRRRWWRSLWILGGPQQHGN